LIEFIQSNTDNTKYGKLTIPAGSLLLPLSNKKDDSTRLLEVSDAVKDQAA
jgi:hypothetical protein